MKYFFLLLFQSIIAFSIAQKVEILSKVDIPKNRSETRFELLNLKLPSSKLQFVGIVKASGKDNSAGIDKLFF